MRRGFFVSMVVLLCVLAGGAWLVSRLFSSVLRSIIPIAGMEYSTSMAPTDIIMQSDIVLSPADVWPRPIVRLPRVWHLTIPRAFVIQEIGSRNVAYDPRSTIDTAHYIRLDAQFDSESNSFIPTTILPLIPKDKFHFSLFFSNEPTISVDERQGNYCETIETRLRKYNSECNPDCERFGNDLNAEAKCLANSKCTVYMGLSGWSVELTVPINQYANYQSYCDKAKLLLDNYTISQDSAFVRRSETEVMPK